MVAVMVLVLSLGLHWAALQTIAWTGMLISYSRDASFKEAVTKTFDGEHPCPLCSFVDGHAEAREFQTIYDPARQVGAWHLAKGR